MWKVIKIGWGIWCYNPIIGNYSPSKDHGHYIFLNVRLSDFDYRLKVQKDDSVTLNWVEWDEMRFGMWLVRERGYWLVLLSSA